ncbi:MAG: tyrosine-type recombinase/integrase, partial [Hyphomicrobiales bacterium]
DAFEIVRQEIDGKFDGEPQSRFVRETIAADQNQPKPGERLEDYLEKYEAEEVSDRQRKPANVEQAKYAIELFIEWVGAYKNVANLTRRDASSFREVLSKFPARRGSLKQLKAESIPRCIEIAERDDLRLLSVRTKNRYISDLSGFFKWMKKLDYCEENIWIGMSFDTSNAESSYPPFSTDQLNQIMKSPLYSGFLRDGKEHEIGNVLANDWRFWLPLLCMFTGARITEIAQMFVDDIHESEGHLAGYIRKNSERGQSVKTKLSARLVVFHPILLGAGFREYWQLQVKRAAQDGNEQLFPELTTYEKRPELGRKPARWWRTYLTKIGIKSGADGIGSHSFRHRLADEMRLAGYLDAEFGLLVMGHSNRSMTSRYGEVPQGTVKRLADMISKAEFKGVDFSNILPKTGE